MKLKLLRNSNLQNDKSTFYRFLNMINPYAWFEMKSGENTATQEKNLSEKDYESIDDFVHIDFLDAGAEGVRHQSEPIQFVIFIDKEPEFSGSSIPVLIFSLDLLMEEKIEMLDAGIVSDNKIVMIEKIVSRLNNNKNMLQDALSRHYSKENSIKNKKLPLW